MLTIRTRLVKV